MSEFISYFLTKLCNCDIISIYEERQTEVHVTIFIVCILPLSPEGIFVIVMTKTKHEMSCFAGGHHFLCTDRKIELSSAFSLSVQGNKY